MIGDFIGFSFAGVHCNELGITRVSEGDRYEETLHPEIKDITAEVPGMDGEYYFGSTYGNRDISVSIAFDSITEEQFRAIQKLFGQKHIGELIFDERPYKKYLAKIESPIELSYICFDEQTRTPSTVGEPGLQWETVNGERQRKTIYPYIKSATPQRIYKGEGKIDFICYYPFAKSVFKVLPNDSDGWAVSSGILSAEERSTNHIDEYNNGVINVYNAGDLPTGFRLYVPSSAAGQDLTLTYTADVFTTPIVLKLKGFTLQQSDIGFLIDTNNELVIGVSSFEIDQNQNTIYTTSGNLYNAYVDSGYFFKLQPNLKTDNATLQIEGGGAGIEIFYDYLYF